jgi:hypothetical protein
MKCHEIQEMILDGEWTSIKLDEARKILDHMENCESCRSSLTEYDHIRSCLQASVQEESLPPGGCDAFEKRLNHVKNRSYSGWMMSGLVAAGLVLAFLGGHFWDRIADLPKKSMVIAQEQLDRKDISDQVSVFHQVSDVFEGRAGWVVQAKDTTDVGVVSKPIHSAKELLLLRLTISRQRNIVSQADLVIVPGQTAKLRVPFENGENLYYRISTTEGEPTGLRISAEVEKPGQSGEVLAALGTTLQIKPGDVRSAGQMVTSSGGNELTVAFSKAGLSE